MEAESRSGFPAHQPHTPRHHLNEKSTVQTGQSSTYAVAGHMAQMLLGHACPWPTASELRYACATPQRRPTKRSGPPLEWAPMPNLPVETTAAARLSFRACCSLPGMPVALQI